MLVSFQLDMLAVMGVSEKNINMITRLVRFAWLLTDCLVINLLPVVFYCLDSFCNTCSAIPELGCYCCHSSLWPCPLAECLRKCLLGHLFILDMSIQQIVNLII
jgi:hypothetical protein